MTFQPSQNVSAFKAFSRKLRKLLARPPVGRVNLGDLDRVRPIDENWGLSRGRPVDRFYIESFLSNHAADIKGRVLEVQDNRYTMQFGGDQVTASDILHKGTDNPAATIIADLTDGDIIPSDAFDCVICTQTLHMIYDVPAALHTIHRILRPGGVLLATMPTVTRDTSEGGGVCYYWRFTGPASERFFEDHFKPGELQITSYGNVYSAVAFLHGLACEDLETQKLEAFDPKTEVIIGLRAMKRA
jgi:SAM-dependent methyltransferase